jgi:twitching motility protein PilT
MDTIPELDELLVKLQSVKGSDLHLKVGSPPAYRISGDLHLSNLPKLRPQHTEAFARSVLTERAAAEFEERSEVDFAYGKPSLGRFRVNCYRQRGSIGLVLRAVKPAEGDFEKLGLPEVFDRLCSETNGMIIVAGGAATGKSTTLAAMLDRINSTRRANIITLEDPIETLHPDKMSIVSQREVGVDTASYAAGMRRVLRQDPDVILIGELQDRETIEYALQAASTSHLVLASMNTAGVMETIFRVIDFFPPTGQPQTRSLLASTLRGILAQKLVPMADEEGQIPAVEVLVAVDRVLEFLVDADHTNEIQHLMREGDYYGMNTFDQALLKLYEKRKVTFQDAMSASSSALDFKVAAQRLGLVTT